MAYQPIPQGTLEAYRYAFEQAKTKREEYFAWIKSEIDGLIKLMSSFDFIYILGGLGVKLLKSTPTFHNQFLANYEGLDKNEYKDDLQQEDDSIEVLLEYAMNIAAALPNSNKGKLPTKEVIEQTYERLSRIKFNAGFWEMSNGLPTGDEFDRQLRTNIVMDSLHVRGNGFTRHVIEIYKEVFAPHNGFLQMQYSFNAHDLLETVLKLDGLVYSKVGNAGGATYSHRRLTSWMEKVGQAEIMDKMMATGKHFIQQFVESNPDLYDEDNPQFVTSQHWDNIAGYNKLFWVIPESAKEELIFAQLSQAFGENNKFFIPEKFKAFPLNDTMEGTVKLTTLRQSKLTTLRRLKLTTPRRPKLTSLAGAN